MSWELSVVVLTLVAVVALLVKNLLAPSVVFLLATTSMLILGIISTEEAFAGFSNSTLFSIASLFVLAKAVEKTVNTDRLAEKLLGKNDHTRRALATLLTPVAALSAFMNNTPIVAMLISPLSRWGERHNISASSLLIPLSYATIFGGVITVIGTSTNLVVSGLLQQSGYSPIGFFEITKIGLPVAIVGVSAIVLLGPKLLPKRKDPSESSEKRLREFVLEMAATDKLSGKTVGEAKLRHLSGVFLISIERVSGDVISPAEPSTLIQNGDVLQFAGNIEDIIDLTKRRDLLPIEHKHVLKLSNEHTAYYEAVIGQRSPLVGKTPRQLGFRGLYQAAVLSVHRSGERLDAKPGSVRLRVGDSLLLASDDHFAKRWTDRGDFLLVNKIGSHPKNVAHHGLLMAAIAAATVGMHLLGAPLEAALILGALMTVVFNIMSTNEAMRAIDFELLIMIGAAFGLASAVGNSGLASDSANLIVGWFDAFGNIGLLLGVMLATIVLTELITNAAAATLMFPIAIATANAAGSDPRAFAIIVAISASLSFLTPVGYQTNTMVYGPGGYRFTDYLRLGSVMTVLAIAVIIYLAPRVWQI